MGGPRYESLNTALSLAKTGVYGNPYLIPTGPTAHPDLIPTLIEAGFYWLLGDGPTGDFARHLFTLLLVASLYALLPWFALRLGWSARIGWFAGLVGAFVPLWFPIERSSLDAILTALALLVLSEEIVRLWKAARYPARSAVFQGTIWGVAAMCIPAVGAAFAGIHTAGLLRSPRGSRTGYLRYVLICGLTVAVLILPWTIRNYVVMGGFVPLRDNFGLELYLSNHPGSGPLMMDNLWQHPLYDLAEAERVRAMGELAYNRAKLAAALAWIKANPWPFLRLVRLRIHFFWLPWTRVRVPWLEWIITLLAFGGLWRLWSDDRTAAPAFLALWISFPLIYYVIEGEPRYRYPMEWSVLLLAAYAADSIWRRVRRRAHA